MQSTWAAYSPSVCFLWLLEWSFLFLCCFETRSHYIFQASLELSILLLSSELLNSLMSATSPSQTDLSHVQLTSSHPLTKPTSGVLHAQNGIRSSDQSLWCSLCSLLHSLSDLNSYHSPLSYSIPSSFTHSLRFCKYAHCSVLGLFTYAVPSLEVISLDFLLNPRAMKNPCKRWVSIPPSYKGSAVL